MLILGLGNLEFLGEFGTIVWMGVSYLLRLWFMTWFDPLLLSCGLSCSNF